MIVAISVSFAVASFLASAAMAYVLRKTIKLALESIDAARDSQLKYHAAKSDLELHVICLEEAKRALAEERSKKSMVIYAAAPGHVAIDDQLADLIRLAVSNPEPKEGDAAARIVCKRLKEMIT